MLVCVSAHMRPQHVLSARHMPSARHMRMSLTPKVDPATTSRWLPPTRSDEALWLISRTPALEASLRTRQLEVVVFDDAGGEDPMLSIVGVAHVPLEGLAQVWARPLS